MNRLTGLLFVLILALGAARAAAALDPGQTAPSFEAEAALDGRTLHFSLDEALKRGPVVLYFYPKAFTKGCTIEAHLFAEAIPEFSALGAQVLGMSGDDIETLKRFSVEECRSRFAVAADPDLKIADRFEARMAARPEFASRTSFVIAQDGTILSTLTDPSPQPHIVKALEVLKARAAGS